MGDIQAESEAYSARTGFEIMTQRNTRHRHMSKNSELGHTIFSIIICGQFVVLLAVMTFKAFSF